MAETEASLQYLLEGALAPRGCKGSWIPPHGDLPASPAGFSETPSSLHSGELPFIYKNSCRKKKLGEYLSKQIFASLRLSWRSDTLIFLFIQHASQAVSECTIKSVT